MAGLEPSITQRGREAVTQIEETEAIARSDLQFARIMRIERIKSTGPFVYDFSVSGTENFVAGLGGVLCHNTAAGLSAAVIREKNTFMLEAGVVVLADQGIACIDEFDKMKEDDRSALHEQMEQQTITIAKGGIYATLNARTSILAAANPIFGKYDPYKNLTDNITLPIPLLTRFDLIFVVKDTPTPAQDEKLATHILDVHRKRGYTDQPPVQFDLLKKYISYAKKISPTLTMEAENRLKEFYLQLRRSVAEGQIGATPRTLESLIRLSSAKARLMLRDSRPRGGCAHGDLAHEQDGRGRSDRHRDEDQGGLRDTPRPARRREGEALDLHGDIQDHGGRRRRSPSSSSSSGTSWSRAGGSRATTRSTR